MKLLSDVNVLVALMAERHTGHKAARAWLGQQTGRPLVICRFVQMGFIRLLANGKVMGDDAVSLPAAWDLYARIMDTGRFSFALEPHGLDSIWWKLCEPSGRAPLVVMDAYLAAFAIAGGYHLVTMDKGFSKFPGLDTVMVA